MNKYYYATELDPEYYYWENYIDEDMLVEDGIAICGNSNLMSLNENLIKNIEKALDECKSDLDDVRYNDDLEEAEQETQIKETVRYYFGREVALTDDQIFDLARLCDRFSCCNAYKEHDLIILEALSISSGKDYAVREISGCCQGDWNTIYYPKDVNNNYIKYVEAVYFGTGTELSITENKVSEDEIDTAESYCDYTYLYNKNDIKKWLAENIGCTEDEVKIRTIKNTYTTKHYEYEEI